MSAAWRGSGSPPDCTGTILWCRITRLQKRHVCAVSTHPSINSRVELIKKITTSHIAHIPSHTNTHTTNGQRPCLSVHGLCSSLDTHRPHTFLHVVIRTSELSRQSMFRSSEMYASWLWTATFSRVLSQPQAVWFRHQDTAAGDRVTASMCPLFSQV